MYCVYEKEIMVEEDQSYYTYGIEARGTEKKIGDISVVRSEVEELADLMNRLSIEPEHMLDVADDWLAGR